MSRGGVHRREPCNRSRERYADRMRPESLDFLKAIVNAPSPSGYEQPAARAYRAYTEGVADRVTTDVHGNVAAILNPEASTRIMLAGHMDEIGFIIHHLDDEGLLHFQAIGGHDSAIPVGQRVWVHGKQRVAGVIGRTAIHLQDETERKRKPEFKDLWIDIGATSRPRGGRGRQPRRRRHLPVRVPDPPGRPGDGARIRQQDGVLRGRRSIASPESRTAGFTPTSESTRWRPCRKRSACAAPVPRATASRPRRGSRSTSTMPSTTPV